jgi:hypothetical protein
MKTRTIVRLLVSALFVLAGRLLLKGMTGV